MKAVQPEEQPFRTEPLRSATGEGTLTTLPDATEWLAPATTRACDTVRASMTGPPPDDDPRTLELRRACAALVERLRGGEDVRAEDVFRDHPAVAADIDQALELIYTEFVTRRALGYGPT